MNQRQDMTLYVLLLGSLIFYDFTLAWAQNAPSDASGDSRPPQSPTLFNILPGRNLSITLDPSMSPALTTDSDPSIQDTMTGEDSATMLPTATSQISATTPPSSTSKCLSTELPSTTGNDGAGRAHVTGESSANMSPATGEKTTNVTSTTGLNSTSIPTNKSNTSTNTTTVSGSSTSTSSSASEDTPGVASSTVTGSCVMPVTTNKSMASLRSSVDAVVNPRTAKRGAHVTNMAGRISLRVKIRSSVSMHEALRLFSEKACDLIMKPLRLTDIVLTLGPDRTLIKCLDVGI
ncbi:uncharacterized protein LOC142158050 [Mixophyes fleayi]|uniref:uncharacterized protein LOC142158050 n=1 Tax=Mixophyes fleayi TaxID=3061075 RepID=UPI003F4D7D1C